jgi:hypothetical protein
MLHLLCVAVVLLLLLPLVPESPRYLLVKGKTEQAQQVLRKVRHARHAAVLYSRRCCQAQSYTCNVCFCRG